MQSLGELVDLATPNEPDPASGRLRDRSVYRGVGDKDWPLLSSLDRLGGTKPPHSKAHLEEHLLRNFMRHGRPYLPQKKDDLWEMMVIGEHHGLPTRLLDWTRSPLVAAHFATLAPATGSDRIIWRLDWRRVHEHFGLRPVVFLLEDLDGLLKERGLPVGWEFLRTDISEAQTFVCLIEPPAVTDRLAVQSGSFTLCSAKNKSLHDVLEEAGIEEAITRFIIPSEKANFLRDQLDLCTLDERRLFPGLDGIAAELRRYYSSTGDTPPQTI